MMMTQASYNAHLLWRDRGYIQIKGVYRHRGGVWKLLTASVHQISKPVHMFHMHCSYVPHDFFLALT